MQGNVGWSVAENMMSGTVRVKGFASECAGASAHGGLLVIEGSASSRCGISMKGVDIVVGEDVGHMSAFMAQAGHLVICGNAGASLGDSLYEAVLYVRGTIHSLGADAREEPMAENDYRTVDLTSWQEQESTTPPKSSNAWLRLVLFTTGMLRQVRNTKASATRVRNRKQGRSHLQRPDGRAAATIDQPTNWTTGDDKKTNRSGRKCLV